MNSAHLIEIEQQIWEKITKIQQNNAKIISITSKFQYIY